MAINVSLLTLSTLNNTSILGQSNANFSILQTALLDCLSLSGQSPNKMGSTLDMNSNQIINLPPPATINSPARLVDVVTNPTITIPPVFTGSGAPTISAIQGALYLRTDGNSPSTRVYVNTNGSTGWTNLVSAT